MLTVLSSKLWALIVRLNQNCIPIYDKISGTEFWSVDYFCPKDVNAFTKGKNENQVIICGDIPN